MNSTPSPLQNMAWHRMHQHRTCPPAGVLLAGGTLAQRHLASCAGCRQKLELAGGLADAGRLLARIPLVSRPATSPAPGDIRRVRPAGDPAAWFDASGRYRNPPLVLVLSFPDSQGFVRVAQCFDEPDLCDLGDVQLGDGYPLIAEAWNVYGLPVSGLAPRALRRVDPCYARQVLDLAGLDYPAISTTSALYLFRMGEAETGSFFSMALNAQALADLECAEAREHALSGGLHRQMQGWLGREWTDLASPLPMAAAASACVPDDGADVTLRLACLAATSPAERPASVPCEVHVHRLGDGGMLCTAYIPVEDGPARAVGAMSCAGVQPAEGTLRTKRLDGGVFRVRARFEATGNAFLPDPRELRTALTILGDEDACDGPDQR